MASTIGLKVANGEFYSLIEENSAIKKRLILTTVHDSQGSVQIDLYKSYAKSMADALYIGSLVVENIKPRPKGEPSIEMIVTSTKEGEISADATDLDASSQAEHHHLSVSLKSFDEDNRDYEIPDFELEANEPPPRGLYERASVVKEAETKKSFPWIVVIIGIIIAVICLLAWLFLFRSKAPANQPNTPPEVTAPAAPPADTETVPVIEAPPEPAPIAEPPAAAPQTPPAAAANPVPAAPASARRRPAPPVASYRVPAVIPPEGVTYKIRWGDTLWDISEAFYRNPWLYTRLARVNNIRNPDLIISGKTLRIPPK